MTSVDVTDVLKRTQSTANGSTTDFSFSFQVNNTNEIKVYEDSTLKTEGTHYDIVDSSSSAGLNANGTGVVKFKTSPTDYTPANNKVITILSLMSLARSSVYSSGGNITAGSLEADYDRIHRILGDFREAKSRTVIAPEYSATSVDMTLPAKATRAGKLLGFNSSTGNPEATFTVADGTTLASVTADIQTLAHIEDGTDATDAIQSVATIASNVTTVAGIASNVTSVAGVASLITSDFVTDLNLLATSAIVEDLNILATSDIVSDLNSLATSDFVSDLNAVEGIKANITTVANNVSSVSSFANRYRVASSDPSDSLDEGDLFFNTTSNTLKYYNGSSWSSIVSPTSGISSGNVATFTSGVADDDFLRVNGTSIEGRSASELASDISSNITSLGTLSSLTTSGNIELGHASDTTISRSASGTVQIEGNTIVTTANSDVGTTTTSSSDADHVLIDDGGVLKKITPTNLGIGTGVTEASATATSVAMAIALG